jgi:hypothetical protein
VGSPAFDPKEFGVEMERSAFIDLIAKDFSGTFTGTWPIDELCIRPRDAIQYCDDFRRRHRCPDVPDYIILGSLMNRRENP